MDDHTSDHLIGRHLSLQSDVSREDARSCLLPSSSRAWPPPDTTEDRHSPVNDNKGVRKRDRDSDVSRGETSKLSTAVHWKGLPRYLLTWELLNIGLSLCFLGR